MCLFWNFAHFSKLDWAKVDGEICFDGNQMKFENMCIFHIQLLKYFELFFSFFCFTYISIWTNGVIGNFSVLIGMIFAIDVLIHFQKTFSLFVVENIFLLTNWIFGKQLFDYIFIYSLTVYFEPLSKSYSILLNDVNFVNHQWYVKKQKIVAMLLIHRMLF